MRDAAIYTAIKPTAEDFKNEVARSDGNMVVARRGDYIAVAFKGTEGVENTVIALRLTDAKSLAALLNAHIEALDKAK